MWHGASVEQQTLWGRWRRRRRLGSSIWREELAEGLVGSSRSPILRTVAPAVDLIWPRFGGKAVVAPTQHMMTAQAGTH